MLKVRNLSQRYGDRLALKSLSFALPRGGFNALLGPNGAGKSTLFQVLTGLFAADEGDVEVAGLSMRSDVRGARLAARATASAARRCSVPRWRLPA